jgi:hypothetical protein
MQKKIGISILLNKKVEEILSSQKMQKIISFKIIPIKVTHKGKYFQSAKVECVVNMKNGIKPANLMAFLFT